MNCSKCGYNMDVFDKECPRCANGIVQVCVVKCPTCGMDNSSKRYACLSCDARLPTNIADIVRYPLKEYQKKATLYGHENNITKSIVTLEEAAEFYPDDLSTRQALISLFGSTGNQQQIAKHQGEVMLIHMKQSESMCIQYGDDAHNSGKVQRAVDIFVWAVKFHPHSATLHERLAAAYEDNGDEEKAKFEARLAARIANRNQQSADLRQEKSDKSANSVETAGVVAGTAMGATGAAIGGGITVVSLILGILLLLFGVLICIVGVVLCITIIGILPGIVVLGIGVAVITAGCGIMAGGAAAGATTGILGVSAGAVTGGASLLHRSTRKKNRG